MQFSETEVRFLRQENATRRLRPVKDLREIGCPASIFERILEARAKKLGKSFEDFRNNASVTVDPDLDARVQAAKLF